MPGPTISQLITQFSCYTVINSTQRLYNLSLTGVSSMIAQFLPVHVLRVTGNALTLSTFFRFFQHLLSFGINFCP